MSEEKFIIIALSIASISSFFYIPKGKFRKAFLSFHVFQATTWAVSIYLVQTRSIAFPFRIFTHASKVALIPEFILFPTVFMWYILLFPSKRIIINKLLHLTLFVSIIVWYIIFAAEYAHLEVFVKGTVFSQLIRLYISFPIQFIICHLYIWWFYKERTTDRRS